MPTLSPLQTLIHPTQQQIRTMNATYKTTKTDTKTKLLYTLLAGAVFGLTSCDGGGGGGDSGGGSSSASLSETIDGATSETVVGATDTGADTALESAYAEQVAYKINDYRAGLGLSDLERMGELDALAAQHNQYMAEQARASGSSQILISHDNSQSRGNAVFAQGYTKYGENVAANRGYASDAVTDNFVLRWVSSEGHRENLERDFTHTGIDVYVDPSNNTIYATQVFAKR